MVHRRLIHKLSIGALLCFLVTFRLSAKYVEINLSMGETLESVYTSDYDDADSIKICGYFQNADLEYIKQHLCTVIHLYDSGVSYKQGVLSFLDLSDAKLCEKDISTGKYIEATKLPARACSNLALSEILLPKVDIQRDSFSNNVYLKNLQFAAGSTMDYYCFENCTALDSVEIPNNFTMVLPCFRGNKLKKYVVDADNKTYADIDGLLLSKDKKQLLAIPGDVSRIRIPSSVTIADTYSIEKNQNLEVIEFGPNLERIQGRAFYLNPRLDRVILTGQIVPTLESKDTNGYFVGCKHFQRMGTLYVPSGTKQLYQGAVGWKEIPNIIEYATEDLESIFEMEVTDDPTDLDYDFCIDGIYYQITSFEDQTVAVVNGYKPYKGEICIPESVTYKNKDFKVTAITSMDNGDITSLTLPESIISVGSLSGNSFSSIELPNSIEAFGEWIFGQCTNLKEITIPSKVLDLPAGAFDGCISLEQVNWEPIYLAHINKHAFRNCVSLKTFRFTQYITGTGTIEDSTNCESSFYNCIALDSIDIEEGITLTFGYTGAGSVSNDVGEFYGSQIKKLYLGRKYYSYQYRPNPVFSALETLVIGDQLDKIVTWPTSTNLKELTIGTNLTELPAVNSDALETVWIRTNIPPNAKEFSNTNYMNTIVYVPTGSLDEYQNAPIWKKFFDIREYDVDADIKQIETDINATTNYEIYDVNGIRHAQFINGINIVKYRDGLTKKIYK